VIGEGNERDGTLSFLSLFLGNLISLDVVSFDFFSLSN
jgi:hypothetical protein